MNSLFEKYVASGGVLMWALVPCSLLMLGAALQNVVGLRRGRMTPPRMRRAAAGRADDDTTTPPPTPIEWLRPWAARGLPMGELLIQALDETDAEQQWPSAHRLDEAIRQAATGVCDVLRDRLHLLAAIYTVAPLLGLMGTILGMMDTFGRYAGSSERSIELLSIGIMQALVTTLWGLAIAIVAYVAHEWLHGRIDRYEDEWLPTAAIEVARALAPLDDADRRHGAS